MSAEAGGSGGTGDKEDRKSKRTKYSDDDKKPSSGSGTSDAELASFHMFSEGDRGNPDDFIKQKNHILQLRKQHALQKSAKGKSSYEDSDGDFQIGDYINYSTDSDGKKEDLGHVEELVFELEISDRNRLVIPHAMACHHFLSMEIQPDSQETLHLYDPFGRRWIMTLIYDTQAHAYVLTNGLNNYLEHNCLNPPDVIRVYRHVPQLKITDFYIQHQKRLGASLFDVRVPLSNRLRIPCEKAKNHLSPSEPPRSPNHLREFPFYLTDNLNRTWDMRYVCFEDEETYVVVRGWEQYVAHHGLSHNDKIRFFRQNAIPRGNRFVVHHELRQRVGSVMISNAAPPLFLGENLFFEQRLSAADIEFGRLEMPGLKLSSSFREREMVKLTDVNHKDWYVIIVFSKVSREYMILDGWEGIVREHNLEAGDMVRLYQPVDFNHDTHFLIECVKKKKTEKEEGGSGSGKPDDGAGPSSIIYCLNWRMRFHVPTTKESSVNRLNIELSIFARGYSNCRQALVPAC